MTIVIPLGASIGIFGPNGAYYNPDNVTILLGATVTWVNGDNYTHGIQSDSGAFFKQTIKPMGGTFSFTFTKPGVYLYRCTIHSWMAGEIIVSSG